jgi:hypothetical protein
VLAVMAPSTSAPFGEVKVSSVHGTYKTRDKAVAAAKHLSGIFGNKLFGVAVSGVPGQEKYTVVGLKSDVPLTAKTADNLIGEFNDGWSIDTIAFSAKSAKRIPLSPPVAPTYDDGLPPVPDFYKNTRIGPPAPPSPPVPAPAPAPHTH